MKRTKGSTLLCLIVGGHYKMLWGIKNFKNCKVTPPPTIKHKRVYNITIFSLSCFLDLTMFLTMILHKVESMKVLKVSYQMFFMVKMQQFLAMALLEQVNMFLNDAIK